MDTMLEIARAALAIGIVIANIGVWRGVYLEKDEFPKNVRDRGWKLLVRSLAAEAALAFFLLATDTTISLRQKWMIAELHDRAAEAELKASILAKQASPRRIDPVSFNKRLAGLRPQRVEILYLRDSPDGSTLALDISAYLFRLGWRIEKSDPIPPPPSGSYLANGPLTQSVCGQPSGVSIVARTWTPEAEALLSAIGDSFGSAGGAQGNQCEGMPPEGMIRIVIGPKPDLMIVWPGDGLIPSTQKDTKIK